MRDSDIQQRLQLFGFEPFPVSPEDIANLIRVETVKYGELVRRAGISAQ
jgi:tripartite-type tricarboxylate transporter receptor subunit TctC